MANMAIFFVAALVTTFSAHAAPRLLLIDITSDEDLQTAFGSWCNNSATTAATYGTIESWDTSKITSLRSLASYCSSITTFNSNVDAWDVSGVLKMDYVFQGASVFDGSLSDWDTSSVRLQYMVYFKNRGRSD